jgi:6,7-dimethyl-8-ribityllumazine synthase
MPKTFEGHLQAHGLRIGIVVARFNEFISSKLLAGALDALARHGAVEDDIGIAWVPGAFEIPIIARHMANSSRYDAVICLGCIIRGSTPHFEYIAAEASKGIAQVAMKADCPVAFGVLTTENIEQAIERAGTKAGNKGWDAALAAIEMANLIKGLNA